jgi:hypothetical protein
MKVNIIEVPTPMVTEFTMFAKIDKDKLKETKTVRVTASKETKTRISTTLQIGQARNKINFAVEGVKTHEEQRHSYFSSDIEVSNYFVKSKKQDAEAYKEYVKAVVEDALVNYIGVDLDEVTVELELSDF